MLGSNPWLRHTAALQKSLFSATALALMLTLGAPVDAAPSKSKTRVAATQKAKASPNRVRTSVKAKAVKPRRVAKVPTARGATRAMTMAPAVLSSSNVNGPRLESDALVVVDERTGTPLLEKNAGVARPIASITKLMTAMVILDAKQPMHERLTVQSEDVDRLKFSSSRLAVGTTLTREQMLHLALMSSENRAAHALGRSYPGGMQAFLAAMNAKARTLGMSSARFVDPTGLDARNVASPADLAKMVSAAADYRAIRRFSTDGHMQVGVDRNQQVFRNTNPLTQRTSWDIAVSKTGYIREAGRCLVMQAIINGRETLIVLMDGQRRESRVQDSVAVRQWLERTAQKTTLRAADLMQVGPV